MAEANDEFWHYCLALYARPGVSPACRVLQDDYGKDVIIALYCCWLGASGRGVIDDARLASIDSLARPWRSAVVEPLRRTRHALKDIAGAEALYARMKAIELEAERTAIARIAPLAPAPDPAATETARAAAARENLLRYIGAEAAAAAAPIVAALDAEAA
ncbi:MAG TPA: TIGR02444 family protein [Stellaceae bacterium]|nr:TIGR02444 family protein [Stellaceae bacterium]